MLMLVATLSPRIRNEHCELRMRHILREVFPTVNLNAQQTMIGAKTLAPLAEGVPFALSASSSNDPMLVRAIENNMLANNLHPTKEQIDKVRSQFHSFYYYSYLPVLSFSPHQFLLTDVGDLFCADHFKQRNHAHRSEWLR